MKLSFDLTLCARTGQCFYLYPDHVREREDGFPEAVGETLEVDRETAEEIVECCPSLAIRLID